MQVKFKYVIKSECSSLLLRQHSATQSPNNKHCIFSLSHTPHEYDPTLQTRKRGHNEKS